MKTMRCAISVTIAGILACVLAGCAREIVMPAGYTDYIGAPYKAVEAEFEALGFQSISKNWATNVVGPENDGLVVSVSIDDDLHFTQDEVFMSNAPLVITAYSEYTEPEPESESEPEPEPEPEEKEEKEEPKKEESSDTSNEPVNVRTSTDKYTQYVKDYRGKNAASFGYSSLGGDRRDRYGAANVQLVFVTEDGKYFDQTDEDQLKDYVVYAQNIAPDTEFKMGYQTDSDGEEYDNLTSWVGIDEIVLNVKKVGESDGTPKANTAITPGDKYNRYVGDYVGRNLSSFGYTSLGSDRRVYVGGGNILLNITAEDGSWVDPTDEEALKDYVVTWQSTYANTPVKVSFDTDSSGKEFDSLGDASIDSIDLTVRKIS